MIPSFKPLQSGVLPPDGFPDPFQIPPHPLAVEAAKDLQSFLDKPDSQNHYALDKEGKMFGVLVVQSSEYGIGYLSGFSGKLNGAWHHEGFVPPVFDLKKRLSLLEPGEQRLKELGEQINKLNQHPEHLAMCQKLSLLEQEYDLEFKALAKLLLERKQKRHSLRQEAQLTRNERVLIQLSFESQNDKRQRKRLRQKWSKSCEEITAQIKTYNDRIQCLRHERSRLSSRLQKQSFAGYQLKNFLREVTPLTSFYNNNSPPGGAGDCAAPKLLQFAFKNKLKPIALAEFWWGEEPSSSIRHHGHFYPPCRGKCRPILPYLLQGLVSEEVRVTVSEPCVPEVIFEDEAIIVLNKPEGLLSVPGKTDQCSALDWLKQHYPEAEGPLLVHRLDMSTSGLLLAAKSTSVYKALQTQFMQRVVKKRYVALLSGRLQRTSGLVELPIRVDLDDRPRQLVCYDYGKPALTRWRVLGEAQNGWTRVYFYPITGRTHQLRIHAAHKLGLGLPIVGDELYGKAGKRLMLHANQLQFRHPTTGKEMLFESKSPF